MKKISNKNKFKQGAASFYMVAITTLVLVIIATSFAAVIIAEIARTSNDDLAQSAYDAAMAGVEDARLAYYNYSNCIEKGGGADCAQQYLGNDRCNSFAVGLGRAVSDQNGEIGEVRIQESSDNNMEQAYTCVKIMKPDDYIDVLDGDSPTKIIKVELGEGESASDITSMKLSWKKVSGKGDLPMLEIGLIQTAGDEFSMSDFEVTKGDGTDQTNRGTVFLKSVFDDTKKGKITAAEGFLKSNDKVAFNEPHEIKCSADKEYPCAVDIELPSPVGGERSDDTFMFTWSMLGGNTDGVELKMELCKGEDGCYEKTIADDGAVSENNGETAKLDMQIAVDATGRANDLYRRVEVRLEKDGNAGQERTNKIYAVSVDKVEKIKYATCENDFGEKNCE